MHRYFDFARHETTYRQETVAGITAFLTIVLISFTYNIGVGMTAGLLSYPLLKTLTGKWQEVQAGMWVLAALSLSFYIFYPYR